MNLFRFTVVLFLITLLKINASGFQINEHGSKAMAMGGAFAALANDPSAIYFNPSGITQLAGTHIIIGTTLIMPKSSFRGPAPKIDEYELKQNIFTPIHLYGTYQFDEKLFFGFGVGNNFGLGTEWEDDWIGKYLAVKTEISTFFLNMISSYKITNKLSIGFGYTLAYGNVNIGRYINTSPFNTNTYLELNGNGLGSGFTAGIHYKPYRFLSLGLSYRSQVTFNFEGEAELLNTHSQLSTQLPNGKINSPLTTPENITFGIAIRPVKNFILTADYQYVGWDSYDNLKVNFEEFVDPETGGNLISQKERNYENSYIVRLGTELILNNKTSLYAGFLFDKNPIKDNYLDPTLPDSDRFGLSFGFQYKLARNLAIQSSLLYLRFDERKITESNENYSGIEGADASFNGVYNSTASLVSITIAYNF